MRQLLFHGDEKGLEELKRPSRWQPAVFVSEYALAQLWMSWGLVPEAMLGHSLGEIVAATLAEVLTLEDALRLVVKRGRLTEELPEGAMVAVPRTAEEVTPHLEGGLALAAVNGPNLVVVSGPEPEIEALEERFVAAAPIRLAPRRAFHSAMVEPMLEPITQLAATFDLGLPKIPYLSNVTGTWVGRAEAQDAGYWARHLRQPVLFHEALTELRRDGKRIFLEIGPGKVLAGLVNRGLEDQPAVASLPGDPDPLPEGGGRSAEENVLAAAGELWCRGASLRWSNFYGAESRRRLPLPTYPFERQSHWFETPEGGGVGGNPFARRGADPLAVRSEPEDWFFLPTWKAAPRHQALRLEEELPADGEWLLFGGSPLGDALQHRLLGLKQRVTTVLHGKDFTAEGEDVYRLDPAAPDGLATLLGVLGAAERLPSQVIYTWNEAGLGALLRLAQVLGGLEGAPPMRLAVVTEGAEPFLCTERDREVTETGPDPAAQASLASVVEVLPKESPHLSCQLLDLDPNGDFDAEDLLREMVLDEAEERVLFRQGGRWVPVVEPLDVSGDSPGSRSRPRDGVYVVTHGLQEIGFALAERLITRSDATVVLVDRSFFPPAAEWDGWIAAEGEDDLLAPRIRRVLELRQLAQGLPRSSSNGGSPHSSPARIQVRTADPGDRDRLRRAKEEIERDHGSIRGVFHLDPPTAESGLIAGKSTQDPAPWVGQRIRESENLASLFSDDLDLLVFFSSNAAESGGLGQVDQAAVAAYNERFAHVLRARGRHALAVAWGTRKWQEGADVALQSGSFLARQLEAKREQFGMTPDECLDALERVLDWTLPQVIVSTRDFEALMEQQGQFTAEYFQQQMATPGPNVSSRSGQVAAERPALATEFKAPRTEVEKLLADGWKLFFGLREIGVHDGFFELGGHSLLAVQILNKINETFSTQLSLREFFDDPTIAGLAAQVAESPTDTDEDALSDLLSEVEGLSEEELEQFLETLADDAGSEGALELN